MYELLTKTRKPLEVLGGGIEDEYEHPITKKTKRDEQLAIRSKPELSEADLKGTSYTVEKSTSTPGNSETVADVSIKLLDKQFENTVPLANEGEIQQSLMPLKMMMLGMFGQMAEQMAQTTSRRTQAAEMKYVTK